MLGGREIFRWGIREGSPQLNIGFSDSTEHGNWRFLWQRLPLRQRKQILGIFCALSGWGETALSVNLGAQRLARPNTRQEFRKARIGWVNGQEFPLRVYPMQHYEQIFNRSLQLTS